MGSGCYGENNGVGGSATPFGHASRGDDTTSCDTLRNELLACKSGDVIRVNVVGDYLNDDGTPDMEYIDAINEAANRGVIVLAYTHAWRSLSPDMFVDDARPQASCDNEDDIRIAHDAGWSTVIVDPADMYVGKGYVTCPNVTNGIKCIDCKMCARQRKSTVVFPVHGMRKNKARAAMMKGI